MGCGECRLVRGQPEAQYHRFIGMISDQASFPPASVNDHSIPRKLFITCFFFTLIIFHRSQGTSTLESGLCFH
ncbi:hypothetical protein DCAR_0832264 [Daucus carota subsp. sativus]|uniref:Uncharacterized protein n=1 Tax=Daucus carota subsp. sativus TaxID=79200 RepID=A0A175YNW7_DAUCS|nr:hypothetical protein DCAR_0832264 [Daucus carota subsp. sativus]